MCIDRGGRRRGVASEKGAGFVVEKELERWRVETLGAMLDGCERGGGAREGLSYLKFVAAIHEQQMKEVGTLGWKSKV